LKGDFEASQIEIAEDVMNWMKNHTLRDLKDIALEMEESGENAEEVWAFIRELNSYRTEGVMELEGSAIASEEPVHA
jgi:hypothetical protein